jgi:hypothetical protein
MDEEGDAVNILEELDELFYLAERDEQWHIRNCIIEIRKAHARRVDFDDLVDLDGLQEEYEWHVEEGIPRRDWPDRVLNYEAYEVVGNVMGSGGDNPWVTPPIRLDEPEEWGIATVYPVTQMEEEDV